VRILGFEGLDEQADLDGVIGPLKAKSPELVFFAGRPAQVGPFWWRTREQGVKARILGSDALDSPAFARLAGPAASARITR
jgi:ABC-type branched-subunit amino acid transport system substrate-binding protein